MTFSYLRYFGCGLALVFFAGSYGASLNTAYAEETSSSVTVDVAPDAFVSNLLDELKTISLEQGADRNARLRETLLRSMAVPQLQRYLIRGDISKAATEDQTTTYNDLFPRYISAAIGDSIDRMVERRIDVGEVNERRPGDYIVRSKIFSDAGEERATLDWRIRSRRGELVLADFMVDGQSFSVERKAQFSAIVKKDGFATLLEHMQSVIDG